MGPAISDRIYLDHAATTPLRPEAKAAMEEGFRIWANPSSPHAEGRKARAALEDARERLAGLLKWDGEVIFTSGASESAALALTHARGRERFVSAVEHDAVVQAARGAPQLRVGPDGAVDLDAMDAILAKADDPLVAIQWINSETGNAQNLGDLIDCVHDRGGTVLVDCAQVVGKYPLPHEADMVIVAAHKFGGPVGVGALLVRDYAMLDPTGGHERGYRRGTENLPGVLGMVAALEQCGEGSLPSGVYETMMVCLRSLRDAGATLISDRLDAPTAYIHAVAMPGIGASAQVMRFDLAGISVSQGSACSSGTMKFSRVLEAMQVEPEVAANTIRVSLGWNTTQAEVERFCEVWLDMARSA